MLTPPRFPHRGVGPAPATDLLGKAARRHSGSLHCRRAARRARQVRGPRPHSRPHAPGPRARATVMQTARVTRGGFAKDARRSRQRRAIW